MIFNVDSEHGMEGLSDQSGSGSSGGGVSSVNKAIQQLAQRYCGDCKNSFDELSKIIQVGTLILVTSFHWLKQSRFVFEVYCQTKL